VIAALLLAVLLADAPAYDALVADAVAASRAGRTDAAGETLARAIALDPARPEAFVERGGVRFLQKRYDEAIRDFDKALRIRKDDPYTREILASTLLLTGRHDRAVAEWNHLGKPALGTVRISGLRHTDEAAVRREVTVTEGELLDIDEYRRTRLRLEESGFFTLVDLRPVVTGPGTVDLEIATVELHGFGSIPETAVRAAVDLTRRKVRARYANVVDGVTVSGEYKWESTQPFLGVEVAALRPLHFPGMIFLDALAAHPTYDFDNALGPFRLRTHGGGVRGRVVVASRTVAEGGVRYRDRTWETSRADAPSGALVGVQAGIDHIFWASRRHDLAGRLRVLAAPELLGSDVVFTRTVARVVHHLHVEAPDGLPLEKGSIAIQASLGYGTDGTPLDEMFTPGAASEMDFPLRAHRFKSGGVLGPAPISRSIALLNVEWRQRLLKTRLAQLGGVLFYDGGRMGRTAQGGTAILHDVGVGARIGLRGSAILRADFGWSLTDGKTALTAGIGQVF
jgi:hypothetical protein